MQKQLNLLAQLTLFKNGHFFNPNVSTQINAGWYDWFCKESSLAKKTESLYKKVDAIAGSAKVDLQKMYVFFKNNCPMDGSLYDDFRLCDIKTSEVIYTVIPKCGHKLSNGKGEIWARVEGGSFNKVFSGSWSEIKNWFLN